MRNALQLLAFLTAAGCGSASSDRVFATKPASFDADQVAREVLAKLDRNGNGLIEFDEARSCPALADAFYSIGTDESKFLTLPELVARFEKYQTPQNGKVPACAIVTLDGQSLAGVKVSFVPESFFEKILKTATGETNAEGRCREFQIDGQRFVGLSAGLYKIRIDGKDLPACYNTETTLGSEVFATGRGGEVAIRLKLTSQ